MGFRFIQALENHFLEFILMIFAISISIFGSAMNIEIKMPTTMKEMYVGISVLCCFICLIFYGYLYYPSNKNENVITIIHIIFVIMAIFLIILGFLFEISADKTINQNNKIEVLKLYE